MKKIAIASLGCAKNLVDTESMLGIIARHGYEIEPDESLADVIIVNTCCFINDAKQESIDTIIDVATWKNEGCCKRLIVTGCLAERYKDEILKELPEVDAVVGVGGIDDILSIIDSDKNDVLCDKKYIFPTGERFITTPSYTAYLKIADGCDNRCTYCVIPSIRGEYQSRPIDDVLCEAEKLVANGAKELIVIAQDTTNYPDLCGLLERLCDIDGLTWIRLHYCYPERITDELIDVMAKYEKICKYIDVPIQHCNDEVLRRMGRRGSKAQIVDVIGRLRAKMPDIAIRTTLITGFPGETEEQYLELKAFIEDMRFERLGVFAYSQEEGTPAAEMDGQIDEKEKAQRQEILTFTQSEIAESLSAAKVGSTVRVLVEGYDELVGQHYGRSEADSIDIDGKVFFKSAIRLTAGQFVDVEISEIFECDLFGTMKE